MNKFTETCREMVNKHLKFGEEGRADLRDDLPAYYTDIIMRALKQDDKRILIANLLKEQKPNDQLDFIFQSDHHDAVASHLIDYLSSNKQLEKLLNFVDYTIDAAFNYHRETIESSIKEEVAIFLGYYAQNESAINSFNYANAN